MTPNGNDNLPVPHQNRVAGSVTPVLPSGVPQGSEHLRLQELAFAVAAVKRYAERTRGVRVTVDGSNFDIKIPNMSLTAADRALCDHLRSLANVTIDGKAQGPNLFAWDFVWRGVPQRSVERVGMTLSYGEVKSGRVYSDRFAHPDGRPKIEEEVDLATGAITSELTNKELAETIGELRKNDKGTSVVVSIDGEVLNVPVGTSRGKSRLETLLSQRLVVAREVVATGTMPDSSALTVYGLRFTANKRAGADVRVTFSCGTVTEVDFYSPRYFHAPGNPKVAERIRGGVESTELSLAELVETIKEVKDYAKRGTHVVIVHDDVRLETRLPLNIGTRYDQFVQNFVTTAASIQIELDIPPSGQLSAFGVRANYRYWGGHSARLTLSHGSITKLEVLGRKGEPDVIFTADHLSGEERCHLTFPQLAARLPPSDGETPVTVTLGGHDALLSQSNPSPGPLERALRDLIHSNEVTIEKDLNPTGGFYVLGLVWNTAIEGITRARVTFVNGVPSSAAHFSKHFVKSDGSLKIVYQTDATTGAKSTELTLSELLDVITTLPEYETRTAAARLTFEGVSRSYRLREHGACIYDTLLIAKLHELPEFTVERELTTSGFHAVGVTIDRGPELAGKIGRVTVRYGRAVHLSIEDGTPVPLVMPGVRDVRIVLGSGHPTKGSAGTRPRSLEDTCRRGPLVSVSCEILQAIYFHVAERLPPEASAIELLFSASDEGKITHSLKHNFEKGRALQRLVTYMLFCRGEWIVPEAYFSGRRMLFPDLYWPEKRSIGDIKFGGSVDDIANTVGKYIDLANEKGLGSPTIFHLLNTYRSPHATFVPVAPDPAAEPHVFELARRLRAFESDEDGTQELVRISSVLDLLIAHRLGIADCPQSYASLTEDWFAPDALTVDTGWEAARIREYLDGADFDGFTLPTEGLAYDIGRKQFVSKLSLLPPHVNERLAQVYKAAKPSMLSRNELMEIWKTLGLAHRGIQPDDMYDQLANMCENEPLRYDDIVAKLRKRSVLATTRN